MVSARASVRTFFRATVIILGLASPLLGLDSDQLAQGKRLFQKRQLPEAKALFEKLAATEPNHPEVNYWLGLTALSTRDVEQAAGYLEKAVAADPTQGRYYHELGGAYGLSAQKASMFSKMGFAKKCIAAFDRAVALEPDNVEYRKSRYEYYRGAPSMVGGGMDKARAELAEIEKRDPVQGAGLRADLLLKEKKVEEAFAVLTQLRTSYPDNKVADYQFGRLSAMTGEKLDEGEVALTAYFGYVPKPSEPPVWAAHWRLAQILEKKNRPADARSHYEETLKLNPSFDRAREALKRLQ